MRARGFWLGRGPIPGMALALVLGSVLFTGCASTLSERTIHNSADRRGLLELGSGYAYRPATPRPESARAIFRRDIDRMDDDEKKTRAQELRPVTTSWSWPLKKVTVTSPFGQRHGDFHEGIDLRADPWTPVYAVQAGKVLYAGRKISGYGKIVVIRHAPGLSTVYAHNSRLLVRTGQHVRQGQMISYSGQTGKAKGPHLHFEVRDGVNPLNPLRLMPTVQGRPVPIANRSLASSSR